MEDFLLFHQALNDLETSPFAAFLIAEDDDPIVARSYESTVDFLRTFIGPDALQSLLRGGALPAWFEELAAAEATDALELDWMTSGDLDSVVKAMPWVRRLIPRLDRDENRPRTSKCLLVPGNIHPIPETEDPGDLRRRLDAQHADLIRGAIVARDAPNLIEETRRTREFRHQTKRLATVGSFPCAGVWRMYTCAKRRQRVWATYLKDEWGVDVTQLPLAQPTRADKNDELHTRLLVVALALHNRSAEIVRAIEGALSDPRLDDPCSAAFEAAAAVVDNDWVVDAVLMKAAPLDDQREVAGINLTAQMLTRISLGHGRTVTKARGRPGKRLDDALHDIGHDDATIPCPHAHDTGLMREMCSLVWMDPAVREMIRAIHLDRPEQDAVLRKATNALTNTIARKAAARRQSHTAQGESRSERREVELAFDPAADTPDPLEEMVAREDAELGQRLWDEFLELLPLLPPRQRQVATLKLVEKLSHPQIAARLGMTKGGSKSNFSKAKAGLRRLHRARAVDFSEIA